MRGISTGQLRASHLWIHCPNWLLRKLDWPTWTPASVLLLPAEEDLELEATCREESSATDSQSGMLSVIDVSRHSSFYRTLAVTAYVLRFICNVRKLQPKLSGPLSRIELATTHRYLVKAVQGLVYHQELAYLLKKQTTSPPLVRQLRLFLDDGQLIRCGWWIHNVHTTELSKFSYKIANLVNCGSLTDIRSSTMEEWESQWLLYAKHTGYHPSGSTLENC